MRHRLRVLFNNRAKRHFVGVGGVDNHHMQPLRRKQRVRLGDHQPAYILHFHLHAMLRVGAQPEEQTRQNAKPYEDGTKDVPTHKSEVGFIKKTLFAHKKLKLLRKITIFFGYVQKSLYFCSVFRKKTKNNSKIKLY